MPDAGRGQIDRLAAAIGVSASQISQVLSGSRELTLEQACNTASHLKLDGLQSEYFLALVQIERTSSVALKKIYESQLERLRSLLDAAEESESMASEGFTVSEADRGVFYSQWYYSAIRVITGIPGMNGPEAISRRLNLPLRVVEDAVAFLVRTGLCIKKGDKVHLGPSRTYAKRGSPFHSRHHLNWRIKALECLAKEKAGGVSYTASVSISKQDALRIKEILVEATERCEAIIEPSVAESLYCLTLDWFEV